MSKICNDCEAIFSDHYTECPSCKSENIKKYISLPRSENDYSIDTTKDKEFNFIEPFVVDGDIDDFGSM